MLGELEYLVLIAILRLGPSAYGVPIVEELRRHTRRPILRASVYLALRRLEHKGLIRSRLGEPEPRRGGRARRYVELTVAARARLRLGFVSSDFREHPMMHLELEHWERTDRSRFETFAYGLRRADAGPIGQRAARAFEHFTDVSAESTEQLYRRIRADDIAILFDLNGYTAGGDSRLMALRPAPIQINSIGFPGTLGADWYDYILVDRFGAPEAMQPLYTERLWYMPHASYPSDTTRAPVGPPPSRAECGLPERGFVFCCFNQAYKILPDVFAIWMRLLAQVPDSILWLLASDDDATANLRREAAAAGIDPARLVFAPKVPQEQHLARHAAADLLVDTFPYGAHTTTNDALLAGLPVVTCAGETLVTRLAGSQLMAIGLPELVTHSLTEYEQLALRLAQDQQSLSSVRARLAANRRTHPLFDMARYARDFEDALDAIWRERATQQARISSA
jgi:predicted O-linked N-acetylglucosamine transferase (SPINDLY family)